MVSLFVCSIGLFLHCHKTQHKIKSRCDVGLHVCKYDGPTAKSVLLIYVKTYKVTFHEKASFRQLVLVLLSGEVAVNPRLLKLGFANCRSIGNKGQILCDEVSTSSQRPILNL